MAFKFFSTVYSKNSANFLRFLLLICGLLSANVFSYAQSTNQNFPTPLLENQISGQIKARDIGDSRLTTYFYIFNGERGDVFINVLTTNLNGDIDIYSAEGLEPKTKITLFADDTQTETGRVIYLRKPEKLILRIKGRTPNDDDAAFQIKFAGSFLPLRNVAENSVPEEPKVNSTTQGKIKVNSVGTIIETPKAKPETTQTAANDESKNAEEKVVIATADDEEIIAETKSEVADKPKKQVSAKEFRVISPNFDPTKSVEDRMRENKTPEKLRVKVTDSVADKVKNNEATEDIADTSVKEITVDIIEKAKDTSAVVSIEMIEDDEVSAEVKPATETNALAGIFLNLQLKNGENFKRSMSEVLSMNVIKGILTIVTNDGKIQEYSILDVAKMTIE